VTALKGEIDPDYILLDMTAGMALERPTGRLEWVHVNPTGVGCISWDRDKRNGVPRRTHHWKCYV